MTPTPRVSVIIPVFNRHRLVAEAVASVGIDDLVARLPEGVDTPCHERGVSLSSGERQLLALARA